MPRKDPTAPVKGAAKAAHALARAQKEAEKKVKAAAKAKAEGKEVPVEDEPVEANAVVAALIAPFVTIPDDDSTGPDVTVRAC